MTTTPQSAISNPQAAIEPNASPQTSTLSLPPTHRDFLIYQRLTIDQQSTRAVAEETHLSQTRIRQIAIKVRAWLITNLPPADEKVDVAHLRLAQHIAADRLEWFYSRAMTQWRETSQIKFANLCLRILIAQSKFPATPHQLESLILNANDGPLGDDFPYNRDETDSASNSKQPTEAIERQSETAHPRPSPPTFVAPLSSLPSPTPVGACSHTAEKPSVGSGPQEQVVILKEPAPTLSDEQTNHQRAARAAFLTTAHPLRAPTEVIATAELQITPNQIKLSPGKRHNRAERRRLQRLTKKQGRS